jgi:hypothetical protein
MSASVLVRSTQKDGNDPDENEDRGDFRSSDRQLRIAIADGATEASFSDRWADALVRVAVEGAVRDPFGEVGLRSALERFQGGLPPSETLPWYALEKLAQGSHAALGAVRLRATHRGYAWQGAFVGDCELFVLKRGKRLRMIRAVPATSAAHFGFHPALVPTDPSKWPLLPVVHAGGRVRPPFELWLVTDALAHACLTALEAGMMPWQEWADASSSEEMFEALVARKRSQRAIRNDDVTMVRVWVE